MRAIRVIRRRERKVLPIPDGLTPVCIIVYLALFFIWDQATSFPYNLVALRILFLAGLAIVLLARHRSAEIRHYFIGRLVPIGSILKLGGMLAEFWHPFFLTSARQFFGQCIVAPVNEEIVFRGVFVSVLLQHLPRQPWLAILVSALVFASVHSLSDRYGAADLNSLLSLLLLGGALGWIFAETRSVPFCILCHALWNLFAFVPVFHLK